ncbi:enoyl-CoA hydratase/isomerase family protein [Streptomyces sp. B-S-A8]|uniref:Enoyl-CoA hydratase/isomerase family protein n=1 Tax=Streptomyces solicavernae TaxID=3043614 RepID=A0ABT6RY38_9ACTN|nr:enoyl-CoA hydratase/isomerase family protein [Streptomyces sp. B-S-A8]MDI3389346.1 enoyl-CoA hydratase/isomerase family protein [Streptomyces sp. B-S-A8]
MTDRYEEFDFGVAVQDGVALVEFNDTHRHNPWSMPRMAGLTRLLTEFGRDDQVRSVVLFSGVGRSFGVGGSFHETAKFTGGDEVDAWIDQVTDLYIASLQMDRPLTAAIDGYAIGIGLQIALTADYRVGSSRCLLKMPEFELGIACTFGGFMLETVVGRAVTQKMLMSCAEWDAAQSERDNLLHEVVPAEALREAALRRASQAAGFSAAGFRKTKPYLNANYIEGLERTRVAGKLAHRAAFAAGDAQRKMSRVIGANAVAGAGR